VYDTLVKLAAYHHHDDGLEDLNEADLATSTKWTAGTGWTFVAGWAHHDGGAGALSQLGANMADYPQIGLLYHVEVTLDEVTEEGTIKVRIGNGTYSGIANAEVGTLEFDVVCGATPANGLEIYSDADAHIRISAVSCSKIDQINDGVECLSNATMTAGTGWDVVALSGWAVDGAGGDIDHTAGSVGECFQLNATMSTPLVAGETYLVGITISDNTVPGNVKVKLGNGSYSDTVPTRLGLIEFYATCGTTITDGLRIYSDTDFTGSVTSASVKRVAFGFSSTTAPFHAVSFRKVWMLTNGSQTFFYSPANGATGASAGMDWWLISWTSDNAEMKFGAVERFIDRLYIGGFNDSSTLFSGTGDRSWEQLWETWIQFHQYETTYADQTIGQNTVFYSKLGGGDYFWPFAVEMSMFGIPNAAAFDVGVPFFLDSIRKRDIGFFHAGFSGEVLRIAKLGEYLAVYGTDGVSIAKPVEDEAGGLSHIIVMKKEFGLLDRV
jgi:hypothetical protein